MKTGWIFLLCAAVVQGIWMLTSATPFTVAPLFTFLGMVIVTFAAMVAALLAVVAATWAVFTIIAPQTGLSTFGAMTLGLSTSIFSLLTTLDPGMAQFVSAENLFALRVSVLGGWIFIFLAAHLLKWQRQQKTS